MTVTVRKIKPAVATLPDNALAKKAMEAIEQIERDAQEKKLEQLESLKSAKLAILERMSELNHQLAQIDKAMSAVTGAPGPVREKRARRNLDEVRERVGRWMEGHRGQRFVAGDLVREFPELDGVAVSIFMKPLIEGGKISTDISEGVRRMKYFVADAA